MGFVFMPKEPVEVKSVEDMNRFWREYSKDAPVAERVEFMDLTEGGRSDSYVESVLENVERKGGLYSNLVRNVYEKIASIPADVKLGVAGIAALGLIYGFAHWHHSYENNDKKENIIVERVVVDDLIIRSEFKEENVRLMNRIRDMSR
jgi:hypothetical protein